jgi:Hint domain
VRIEDLAPGHDIVTADGHRRIKRIQRQIVELSLEHMPVRISRHALDDNKPHRDLYLSPSHCLFVDGVLIPAAYLVNGRTIERSLPTDADEIEYYHIELEDHDIVVAEGLEVESYLAEGIDRYAPYFSHDGGRAELKAFWRRLVEPMLDIRDPVQIASDRLAARAVDLAG